MGRAKFTFPRIPNATIRREALLARLANASDRPVVLIAGSPGSGKSALLADWARELPSPVAWLSCDSEDGDGPTFWRNVSQAVRETWAPAGLWGAEILDEEDPIRGAMALADDLATLAVPGVIVIDDFHLAHRDPATMVAFLAALPPTVRVVLGTRSDPPFALGRMRVQGTLYELRQSDLRFTVDETRAVLAAMSVEVAESDLEQIDALAEGWPAGIHLIGLALSAGADPQHLWRSMAATDRNLTDFLMSEVIVRQPPELREFMMLTAELEAFDPALCDAVTGRSDGAAMLDRVRTDHLFLVELDAASATYRYHHLFGEFLRIHLRRERPEGPADVHRSASEAYSNRGDLRNAVRHSLLAGDVDRARALLGDFITSTMSVDDRVTAAAVARAWLAEHGAGQLGSDPSGFFECVFALNVSGEGDLAEPWLRRWERREPDLGHTARTLLHGAWAFHHLYTGDPAAALDRCRQAKALLDESPIEGPWGPALPVVVLQAQLWLDDLAGARATLAEARAGSMLPPALADVRLNGLASQVEVRAGELLDADRAARRALRSADELGLPKNNFGRADPELTLAALHLEHDRLADAEQAVERAMRIVEGGPRPMSEIASHLLLARLSAARGDEAAALIAIDRARGVLPNAQAPILAHIDEVATRLAWDRQDRIGAELYWRRLPDSPVSRLLAARMRLANDGSAAALAILDPIADALPARRLKIEHRLLSASAHARLDPTVALEAMRDAVELAEPMGFRRTLVAEGPTVWKLLESLPTHGRLTEYVQQLLTAAHHTVPPARATSVVGNLVEPLSERELTVLRYLASRLDSTAIASALYVSVNTVRSHVKSIYRKLGVNSRADAVAKGRALGLF